MGTEPVARVTLRAIPGAREAKVVGRYGDAWKVRVVAAPEQGRANTAICALIASVAGVRTRDVRVVSGASCRDKTIEITGITLEDMQRMLDAASGK